MSIPPKAHYVFTERAEQTVINGKVHYPAYLQVHLSRWAAWELLQTLAHQLRDRENRDGPVHLLMGGGTMEPLDDDES